MTPAICEIRIVCENGTVLVRNSGFLLSVSFFSDVADLENVHRRYDRLWVDVDRVRLGVAKDMVRYSQSSENDETDINRFVEWLKLVEG